MADTAEQPRSVVFHRAHGSALPAPASSRPVIVRVCILAVALVALLYYRRTELAVWATYAVCVTGVAAYSVKRVPRRLGLAGLLAASLASGVLFMLEPAGAVAAISAEMALVAGFSLPAVESLTVVGAGMLAALAMLPVLGGHTSGRLIVLAVFFGFWLSGLGRREYRLRAEQAELLLAETRRATEASTAAAALAERARIAREIHDIQAHSLSALSLQLEAAAGLLHDPSLPADHPVLTKIAGCVARAGRLAREGLVETRRAVDALREDVLALPELLNQLAEAHCGTDEPAPTVRVTGPQRSVSPEKGLALYRTVQEALTNARKYAPSAPVAVSLDYGETEVTATVTNGKPKDQAPVTLAGGGHGLTGLRERAELVGGTLTAGPAGDGWRVSVTIPA